MNILILHSTRYDIIAYDRAIDHDSHHVFYIGVKSRLDDIPAGLRCAKIEREGRESLYREAEEAISRLDIAFDFLICVAEYELMDAARLRKRFNIPGPLPEQAEKVRNKAVMKRCVAEHGIRIPQFATLQAWMAGARLPIAPGGEVVLKPLDGASSVNVRRFENQWVLRNALESKTTGVAALDGGDPSNLASFEVEEYISGPVLHIDGIVKDGEIQIIQASRYVNTLLDFANGKPAGSIQIETGPALRTWAERILAAVEIRQGAFHLEAIDHIDGIVFLEVAHRVGGARITETFERKTGIHLSIADIRTITDPDYVLRPRWDNEHYFGWFVVPAHHLNKPYCRVAGYKFLEALDHLVTLNKLDATKTVPAKVTYAETLLPLAGMLKGSEPEELLLILNELFETLTVEGLDAPTEEGLARRCCHSVADMVNTRALIRHACDASPEKEPIHQ
ncbi:MAG TPA: ATP-grasp domain-containing protein [Noviherbaspirillum sp.]